MKPIQPRPGRWNGVDFRSQLEISWAKYISERIDGRFDFKYADDSAFDFVLKFPDSDRTLYIEIKPWIQKREQRNKIYNAAVSKLTISKFRCGDAWCLIAGSPPSIYGNPVCVRYEFHHICCWGERGGKPLCAIILYGLLEDWTDTDWWSFSPERIQKNWIAVVNTEECEQDDGQRSEATEN